MLAPTATVMLRVSVARSATGLHPVLLRSTACSCPAGLGLSLAPQPQGPLGARFLSSQSPSKPATPSALPRAPQRSTPRRNASSSSRPQTDAQADAAAAEAVARAQAASHPEQITLDWNTFFQLRKTRRRWQQAFSAATALAAAAAGSSLLASGAVEPYLSNFPLDPFMTMGLMVLSFSALGWLSGPALGTAVFNTLKRQYKGPMAVKESQFFARIKKHRVDPSAASVRNPVPDFYGEKISSVTGYRHWLKDQKAFNKKRLTTFGS